MREFSSDMPSPPAVKTIRERTAAGELRSDRTGPRLADQGVTPDLTWRSRRCPGYHAHRDDDAAVPDSNLAAHQAAGVGGWRYASSDAARSARDRRDVAGDGRILNHWAHGPLRMVGTEDSSTLRACQRRQRHAGHAGERPKCPLSSSFTSSRFDQPIGRGSIGR